MRKSLLIPWFIIFIFTSQLSAQTMKLAIDHMENLDKSGEAATTAFFEYATLHFLNKKEKAVLKKKTWLLDNLQNQEEKISKEKPFNGQLRLKNGYANFVTKLKQFPENLGPYSELTLEDYRLGHGQKKKQEFISQMVHLKTTASELNTEVVKYITMNKLKDFKQGSSLPPRWEKASNVFGYCHKIQEAILTVSVLEREFHEKLNADSIEKAEIIRKLILQNAATLLASVKIKPAVPTDFTLREAAINSFNLYRQDAFRNFKSLIDLRKKETSFKQKYPSGAPKNKAIQAKYDSEKALLDADVSASRNFLKEIKKDRDKHEQAFEEYLAQYLEKWVLDN